MILADYRLPSFDARSALQIREQIAPEILLIIVFGTIGEEVAVECIKYGATDYVLKDRLSRLGPVMNRALEEAEAYRERKEAEEVLRKSEERYRTLVEDMPALVCRFLLDGTLTFVNSSYCEYFNKNCENLIGEDFFQFIPEEDREKVRNHFQSLTHKRPMVTYEHQVVTPNGEIRWQRWTDRALFDGQGNLLEYQSMGFDISEHRLAEETIKSRLEFERTVSITSSRFINVSDIDNAINTSLGDMGRACGANRTYLFLFHQDGAIMDNTHEWCAEGVSPQIDNLQNFPCEMFPWWMRKLHKEAVIHITDISKMPAEAKAEKEILENQDIKSLLVLPIYLKGELGGFIGFDNVMETGEWRDDDLALLRTSSEIIGNALERKRSEEALRESELRFRTLFNLSPQAIALSDVSTGRLIDVNDKFCELTKYTREEILGQTTTECQFYSNEDRDKFLKELEGSGEVRGLEMDFRTKDARIINTLMFAKLVRIAGESFILTVFLDLTDHKRLEAQLLQAQKMEAIGTLAGGIAHDFNNLLSVVLGNISMAKEDVKPEYGISEFLNEAEKASLQAKELTHQMITFSKGGSPVKKAAAIIELLKESANLALADSNVGCDVFISEDLWPVEHDEAQMKHVINNLITNADEAMPEGGTIQVRAENVIITTEKEKAGIPLQEGKYVKISIQDQGIGIPEEDLPKVFDLYFSTKERGVQKGMGLGLAAAYSIIKRHDGHIAVESRVGVGTTFEIYLPASEEGMPDQEDSQSTIKRVLVMEDEETLRDLSAKMLERLGYEAELAKDGTEAIELYKRGMDAGEPFDAVILDLSVRGGMGGKQAIQKLQEMDSEVKAIVSSGYTDDPVMSDFKQYGFSAALAKPYLKKDLSEASDKVLVEENVTVQPLRPKGPKEGLVS